MKNYAEENDLLKNPHQNLISSFKMENGTFITPILDFYLGIGLKCRKIYHFVEYTPAKRFNNFDQSVVDARREQMKLLVNSSSNYCLDPDTQ